MLRHEANTGSDIYKFRRRTRPWTGTNTRRESRRECRFRAYGGRDRSLRSRFLRGSGVLRSRFHLYAHGYNQHQRGETGAE